MSRSNQDVDSIVQQSSSVEQSTRDSQSSMRSKYVPPHLRNRPAAPESPSERDRPRDSDRGRQADNDYGYDRRDRESGSRDRKDDDWGRSDRPSRDNYSGSGNRSRDSDRHGSSSRDNREPRDNRERSYDSGSSSSQRRVMDRDERLETDIFGDTKHNTGIKFKNYEDIPVEVDGTNVPKPITSYSELNLDEVLRSNVQLCGYEVPTPVQKHGIPICLNRRDLMACAQTGSGKTCAFLLPGVELILNGTNPRGSEADRYSRSPKARPSVLVLSPTRELATQIYNEARKFTYRTGLKPVVVYGGQDSRNQLQQLSRGCDVLVATPGRLVDFLARGRITLSNVRYLVFDEADRMLDMGFEPQIRSIVNQHDMPQDRQTLMFSATFPKEIQRLAQDFLYDYVFLTVGRVGSTTDSITQKIEYGASDEDKFDRLMQILSQCEGLTLIFVETKRGADSLEYELTREGIEATSIHGDRSQQEREDALAMFRCGRCPVLVATDVAARGLDIPDVRCVINYNLPTNIDDYVHRIGRTGRCGNTGTAISFASEKSPILRELFDLMKEANQGMPNWFEEMVVSTSSYSSSSWGRGSRGGRGGRGGGGSRFASRDIRKESSSSSSSSSGGSSYDRHESSSGSSSRGFSSSSDSRSYGSRSYGQDSW